MDITLLNSKLPTDTAMMDTQIAANDDVSLLSGEFPEVLDEQMPLAVKEKDIPLDVEATASQIAQQIDHIDVTQIVSEINPQAATAVTEHLPEEVQMHPAIQALLNQEVNTEEADLELGDEIKMLNGETKSRDTIRQQTAMTESNVNAQLKEEEQQKLQLQEKVAKSKVDPNDSQQKFTETLAKENNSQTTAMVNELRKITDKPAVKVPANTTSSVESASSVGQSNAPQQTQNIQQAQSLKVTTPVHDNSWREAFAEKITWMSHQSIKSASIQLNPSELGPVEVTLKIHQQQASVMFNSHHAAVREAIEDSLPKLREMLAEQGLNLADANVSEQNARQQRETANLTHQPSDFQQENATEIHTTQVTTHLRGGQGLIDYYA